METEVARGEVRKTQIVHEPELAHKILTQQDGTVSISPDFAVNIRILGQIYETLQKYLTGIYRRGSGQYPTVEEVYKDLQMYRMSVSDKSAMPAPEQFERLLHILATENPPFIHLIRQLQPESGGRVSFVTYCVAPTQKHPDKVAMAYQLSMNQCAAILKELNENNAFAFNEKEYTGDGPPIGMKVRSGRVDALFRGFYLTEKFSQSVEGADVTRIRKINDLIRKYTITPLLQLLIKEKIVLALRSEDLRTSGNQALARAPDFYYFNNLTDLLKRLETGGRILAGSEMRVYLNDPERDSLDQQRKELGEEEYFYTLADLFLKRSGSGLPDVAAELATEVLKLSDWARSREKLKKKEDEEKELRELLDRIRSAGSIYRAKSPREMYVKEKFLKLFLSGRAPMIIATTEPFAGFPVPDRLSPSFFDSIFLLFKDRAVTAKAIETAVELFEKSTDTYLLRTLENMFGLSRTVDPEIKKYIAPAYFDMLRDALKKAYFQMLPWYERFWLWITSSEISAGRMRQIYSAQMKSERRKLEYMTQETEKQDNRDARSQIQSLARSRVEADDDFSKSEILKTVISFVDRQWQNDRFPGRADLLKYFKSELEQVSRILDLVDVGGQSVKPLIRISVPGSDPIYANRSYLSVHTEELIHKFTERAKESEEAVVKDKTIAIRREVKNRDVYEAILRCLKAL